MRGSHSFGGVGVQGEGNLLEIDRLFDSQPERITRSADGLIGKSLDRRKITREEVSFAHAVLAVFNDVASTAFSGQVWLRKIILRFREHPELSVPQHRTLIERNFAAAWWKDEPSPSVIYGNEGIFERAMLCKGEKRPATLAERQSARIRSLLR